MGTITQLIGALLAIAGAVAVTGSGWPLIVGGGLLVVAAEVPGLARAAVRARELRKLRAQYEASLPGQPTVIP